MKKKTISRGAAATLYALMTRLSFGHLSEETLAAVMDNFMELGKIEEYCRKMVDELRKRMFEGVDGETIEAYNAMAAEATEEEMQNAYPTLFPLVMKFNRLHSAIYAKQVEVELNEVDKAEFVKAVAMGTPNLTIGILNNFGVMFKEEKQEFAELDELMEGVGNE